MTPDPAAELRRALEAPPGQQWTSMTPGVSAWTTEPTFVIVNRSTLKAVLDAYERDQEASGFEEWWTSPEALALTGHDHPEHRSGYEDDIARVAYEAGRRFAEQEEADRRTAALRAHPDYEEAIKAAGKKPQPGDLLSTDEEIRAVIHAGNPNRKASPHGRVHGQEPGEAAAPGKRYHTWERVLMEDGQYSMVERDATEYVEGLRAVLQGVFGDASATHPWTAEDGRVLSFHLFPSAYEKIRALLEEPTDA